MKRLLITLTAVLIVLAANGQTRYVPKKGDTVFVYKHAYVLQRDTVRKGARLWYAINERGRWAWLDQRVLR